MVREGMRSEINSLFAVRDSDFGVWMSEVYCRRLVLAQSEKIGT